MAFCSLSAIVSASNSDGLHVALSRHRLSLSLHLSAAGALRENDTLRTQVDRSTAALEAGGDASETSRALQRHAVTVRRLHDEMRANIRRERSAERKLRKKVGVAAVAPGVPCKNIRISADIFWPVYVV